MQFVRIPAERVAVLIGEDGCTKRAIAKRTKCKLSISEGEVSIEGDPVDEWSARDIVHAIGRGFSPEKAFFLLAEGAVLDVIELGDLTPNSRERQAQ